MLRWPCEPLEALKCRTTHFPCPNGLPE